MNLLFAGLIYNGYSPSTLTMSNDTKSNYLYVLPVTALIDVRLARRLFPIFLQKSLKPTGKKEICYEEDGVTEIECWQKAVNEAQEKIEAEREAELEE